MDQQYEAPAAEGWPAATDAADPPTAFWEAWSILAGLAVATSVPKLGTLVTCAGYRKPAFLAKIVDTVDEMSDGRVILGIGAGDPWGEHERYGLAWEQPVGRFEEPPRSSRRCCATAGSISTAVIITRGEPCSYRAAPASERPTDPHRCTRNRPADAPPAGAACRPVDRRFMFDDADPGDDIELALARVGAACELHGRDPVTLGRTIGLSIGLDGAPAHGGSLVGPAPATADRLRRFAELGIRHVQVMLAPPGQPGIEAFAEVLDLLDTGR
jgi:alkanesulfonate monooxygenase SsuD/methylene tetrahydromethanopterin reductase-like flavin-dependent oxidoreductase (luciferase family)